MALRAVSEQKHCSVVSKKMSCSGVRAVCESHRCLSVSVVRAGHVQGAFAHHPETLVLKEPKNHIRGKSRYQNL